MAKTSPIKDNHHVVGDSFIIRVNILIKGKKSYQE